MSELAKVVIRWTNRDGTESFDQTYYNVQEVSPGTIDGTICLERVSSKGQKYSHMLFTAWIKEVVIEQPS